VASSGINLFNDGNFRIGIGDANRDGKLDLDFGIRGQQWGNSPWGGGSQGFEVGVNTQRGGYVGADQSSWNGYGSQSSYGRVFADGGFENGSAGGDVFGNWGASHTNSGPNGYYAGNAGGNVYSGQYYGNQVASNGWGYGSDSVAGNSWTGAQVGSHSRGNHYGGGASWNSYNPGFVPNYGGGHYHGGGCGCASRFLGY